MRGTAWTRLAAAAGLLGLAGGLVGCSAPVGHRHERAVFAAAVAPVGADAGDVLASGRVEGAGFDEALFSWEVSVEPEAALRLQTRVRVDGEWSRWMDVAFRGDRGVAWADEPVRADGAARVEVDMIACDRPADALAWRVVRAGTGQAAFGGVWVTTTAIGAGDPIDDRTPEPLAHDVPHKAQRDGGADLAGRLCSPTAVAMVLASEGTDVGVAEVARRVHDDDFDLYGNWINNTLAASELGVPMHVTRIGSWAEARRFMERGPIVVSLPPFDERELTGAGYGSRSGHLIVLRGFDDGGDVLVRDPAHGDAAEAARTYRRDQLTRLWLIENKGTAYVLADVEEDGRGARTAYRSVPRSSSRAKAK